MPQNLSIFKPLGIDFFCLGKKFLVFNLVSRNLKVKYRRSFAGFLWTLLTPLAMAVVYYFVVKVLFKHPMEKYIPFVLCGVLPWAFFSQSLMEGLESIVGNWSLISKVPVPLQIFPLVGTLTNLVTLILGMPILFGVAHIYQVQFGSALVYLPLLLSLLFLVTYSASLLLSVLFVYLRDLRHAMGVILQVWFYATPVMYDVSDIPEKYRWLVLANPVAPLFVGFHDVFVWGRSPSPMILLESFAWTSAFFLGSLLIFKMMSQDLAESL